MTTEIDPVEVRRELETKRLLDQVRVVRPTGTPVLDPETGLLGEASADVVHEGPGALLSSHGQVTAEGIAGRQWLDDTVSWYRLLTPLSAPVPLDTTASRSSSRIPATRQLAADSGKFSIRRRPLSWNSCGSRGSTRSRRPPERVGVSANRPTLDAWRPRTPHSQKHCRSRSVPRTHGDGPIDGTSSALLGGVVGRPWDGLSAGGAGAGPGGDELLED
ncbi:DUF6093 family protein [Streptomyces sp. NPDC018711]|uniref:DUF6093 family protein n=1 Tax=Streptomyces sp. NPDC018711 TaxID=3365052 RepID=UPI0037BB01B3